MTSLRSRTSVCDSSVTSTARGRKTVTQSVIGIDNDDEEHALRQILLGLCVHLARAIVGRQHLDSNVRRALDEPASTCRRRHALASDESDVRSSDCVGVRCQLEADFCANHADRMLLEMTTQEEADLHHDPAMVEIDRAHANEPAFHQFVTVAVVRQPCQFLSGDQWCVLGHRSVASHGILASSLRGLCRSDLRANQVRVAVECAERAWLFALEVRDSCEPRIPNPESRIPNPDPGSRDPGSRFSSFVPKRRHRIEPRRSSCRPHTRRHGDDDHQQRDREEHRHLTAVGLHEDAL